MSLDIFQDSRIRSVYWRDLTTLNKFEQVKELLISMPWLMLSWFFAQQHLYFFALGCSFIFFLTGLRQVHDAFHYNLGLSRKNTERLIFCLSTLMIGSMHAIQFNHLRHHKHCMDEEDIEALSAKMNFWKAILFGPYFPLLLHYTALKNSHTTTKQWIYRELLTNFFCFWIVFFIFPLHFLQYHFITMLIGHCFTAFFAVWTVHHDCDRSYYIARTLRNRFKSTIAFNMFFHLEHHLYPKVPTCHLPLLAKRLDQVAPEFSQHQVY